METASLGGVVQLLGVYIVRQTVLCAARATVRRTLNDRFGDEGESSGERERERCTFSARSS